MSQQLRFQWSIGKKTETFVAAVSFNEKTASFVCYQNVGCIMVWIYLIILIIIMINSSIISSKGFIHVVRMIEDDTRRTE